MNSMKIFAIALPDGSKWAIPVEVIARNRAAYYANEFDNDIEKSLTEDTLPLFAADESEIKDWAANSMNWNDVAEAAVMIEPPTAPDFQEAWVNGAKSVETIEIDQKKVYEETQAALAAQKKKKQQATQLVQMAATVHDMQVLLQAVWIEAKYGQGAVRAIAWVKRTLEASNMLPGKMKKGRDAAYWFFQNNRTTAAEPVVETETPEPAEEGDKVEQLA